MKKILMFFKIFIYSLLSGIALRIADFLSVVILTRGTSEWSSSYEGVIFYIHLLLSMLLFFFTGFCLRKNSKREILISSALVAVYSVVVLISEQMTQKLGIYNISAFLWAFLPLELYTTLTSVLARITSAQTITVVYALPSLFAPFLFLFFGKKY